MSPSEDFPLSDPVIEAYKADVDRTLLRENLKLTVEERFLKWMSHRKLNEELRRAGEEARAKWSTSKRS
jgi:hypothetical protein